MNLQSHANGSSATRFAPAGVAIPAHHVSSRGRPGALVSHERLNMIRSPSVGGAPEAGRPCWLLDGASRCEWADALFGESRALLMRRNVRIGAMRERAHFDAPPGMKGGRAAGPGGES